MTASSLPDPDLHRVADQAAESGFRGLRVGIDARESLGTYQMLARETDSGWRVLWRVRKSRAGGPFRLFTVDDDELSDWTAGDGPSAAGQPTPEAYSKTTPPIDRLWDYLFHGPVRPYVRGASYSAEEVLSRLSPAVA